MNQAIVEKVRRLEEEIRDLRKMVEQEEGPGVQKSKVGSFADLEGIWKDYGPIDEADIDAVRYRFNEDDI
jgi:hypothetical protein